MANDQYSSGYIEAQLVAPSAEAIVVLACLVLAFVALDVLAVGARPAAKHAI